MNSEKTVFKNQVEWHRNDLKTTKCITLSAPCALTEMHTKQLLGTDSGPVYKALLDCMVSNPNSQNKTNTGVSLWDSSGLAEEVRDNLNLPALLKLTPNGPGLIQEPPTTSGSDKQIENSEHNKQSICSANLNTDPGLEVSGIKGTTRVHHW